VATEASVYHLAVLASGLADLTFEQDSCERHAVLVV
jgi:hypothetical protein